MFRIILTVYIKAQGSHIVMCVPQGSCMCSLRRMQSRCHLNSKSGTSWPIPTMLTWIQMTSPTFTANGPPTKSRYDTGCGNYVKYVQALVHLALKGNWRQHSDWFNNIIINITTLHHALHSAPRSSAV